MEVVLLFGFFKKRKKISDINDLKSSLQSDPYYHIIAFPDTKVVPGSLNIGRAGRDFYVYVDAEEKSGWLMSIEGVSIEKDVLTIRHLSVEKGFRGKKLGKPSIDSFVSLVKKERGISKVIFQERLGKEQHYYNFFTNTLGAQICSSNPIAWELPV